MNRRTFLNFIVRGSILTGLALLSGVLIFRKKSDEVCDLDFLCKNCGKSTKCVLPEAQQFRKKIIK